MTSAHAISLVFLLTIPPCFIAFPSQKLAELVELQSPLEVSSVNAEDKLKTSYAGAHKLRYAGLSILDWANRDLDRRTMEMRIASTTPMPEAKSSGKRMGKQKIVKSHKRKHHKADNNGRISLLTVCLILCLNKVSVVDANMSTLSAYFRTRPGWRQIAHSSFHREASYSNKKPEIPLAMQQENISKVSVQETLEKSNAPQMSGFMPHHKAHNRQHRRHHGRNVVRDHAAALSKAIAEKLEKIKMLTTSSAPANVGKPRRRPYDHNCFFTPINCHPWQPPSEREPRNWPQSVISKSTSARNTRSTLQLSNKNIPLTF
ncbi:hypothetical protein DdX_02886 [Ditylenchus destructor]|uniref:Uncharacterized protein n=1 Tax=Ditylenchus destructor TaxID=166010 RepID=A0AAD4NIM8_9BILA|nr:hypothetical protein DdX_02886 [Ditylenchus destructor]